MGMYLGKEVKAGELAERLERPSERLTRHGVIIGMTGSGKTGLAVGLLEELVLQGVPVIALDPKGDLANLALVFPDLEPDDFEPWVDQGEARRKGVSNAELAAKLAGRWKSGLADWDLGKPQLQALKDKLDLSVYTPGSLSGQPVNVMAALGRPTDAVLTDPDGLRELVSGTVSAILSLVGVQADPLRSPEHQVLARIITEGWQAGEDIDPEMLIMRIVDPPFKKVGVFPLDRYWQPDDRMDLAMQLNGVLASPAFAPWGQGLPLDPDALLRTSPGKTRCSVFYMAHLDEAQRMFFASLLLERVLAWSRAQPGTGALRALIYLDEAFGYLPPHPKNPPTKRPLLTLMKQARAVGVGVVLATQNPVDLDYKALSNAGSWFVGRLSTSQDVERVADGMRQAGAGDVTKQIASLEPRTFVMRDVKEDQPTLFHTRWVMSFLRGPITRQELSRLPGDDDEVETLRLAPALAPRDDTADLSTSVLGPDDALSRTPTAPPTGVGAWFLDPRSAFSARLGGVLQPFAEPAREDGGTVFQPALYAHLRVRFDEEKAGYIHDEEHHRVFFPLDGGLDEPLLLPLDDRDLLGEPPAGARFEELPENLDERGEFAAAKKAVVDAVYRDEARGLWVCAPLKLHGKAGESREDFEGRCREAVEDQVDDGLAALTKRYRSKFDRLEDRIRKQTNKLEDLQDKAKAAKTQEMVNGAEVLASFFFGRKRSLNSVASRRKASSSAANRLDAAGDDLEALQEDLADLQHELAEAQDELRQQAEEALDAIEEREVRLEKNDIQLVSFGILWLPLNRRI